MSKVVIMTDSNSGITQAEAAEIGVVVLPMPFYINEKLYLEGITLSQEEFYERLKNDEAISTSQPERSRHRCRLSVMSQINGTSC